MSLSDHILQSSYYANVDIVTKYKKYPEFQKELQKIEKDYIHELNMSLYSDLEHLQKYAVLQTYNLKTQKDEAKFYLNYYAYKMQFDQDEQHKFQLLFIKTLDEKLRESEKLKFSIIYYHSLSESTFPFSFLNEIFKKLPLFYYAMLEKIYVVEPNFLVKNTVGMFDFGRLHKLFAKRIVYVDSLYEFGKIQEIKKSEVLQHIPQVLRHQKTLKEQKKALKHGALHNIENKATQKHFGQHTPQTTVTLQSVLKQDYLTINLQNHKLNGDGMPIPLTILFETLKSRSQFLSLQGIFRKSGSCEEEQQIIKQLSTMSKVGLLKNIDEHSGYAIAGVIKKFFTKLTIPIIPYELYNEIMQITSIQQGTQSQFVRSIVNKLPNLNKKVLINLILFLKEHVIAKKQQNKMNNYNMSVCFCPCIFRAQHATLEDLFNSGKYAKILDILFNKFQEVFTKEEIKSFNGKENRQSKGSKGSRGSRSSKQNPKSNNDDSPTRILI